MLCQICHNKKGEYILGKYIYEYVCVHVCVFIHIYIYSVCIYSNQRRCIVRNRNCELMLRQNDSKNMSISGNLAERSFIVTCYDVVNSKNQNKVFWLSD